MIGVFLIVIIILITYEKNCKYCFIFFMKLFLHFVWTNGFFLCLWFTILRCYNNAYYAKVGGINTTEMNYLELDFLFGLGFNLNVTPNTFQCYCVHLQREMLQMQPLNFADSSLSLAISLKAHLCFNEDESSHQKQQKLAVWFMHFINACRLCWLVL